MLLRAVRVLHERGAQLVAVFPYLSPTGLYWRCQLVIDGTVSDSIAYTSANGWALPGNPDGTPLDHAVTADRLWAALTDDERASASQPDPDYAAWYVGLLDTLGDGLPILFDDDYGPAPYELGHLRIVGPPHATIPGDGTYPLPPGDSLAALLRRG